MKNATFYLLDNENTVEGLSAVEQLVCDIAAETLAQRQARPDRL